jgi:hypothetical protein
LADLGIAPGESMNIIVLGYDNYFTGWVTDYIDDGGNMILYTPGVPRFYTDTFSAIAAPGGSASVGVARWSPGDEDSPSQTGFLLFHRQAASKRWTDEVHVTVP